MSCLIGKEVNDISLLDFRLSLALALRQWWQFWQPPSIFLRSVLACEKFDTE